MLATQGHIRVAIVVTRFIAGAGGVALRGALALDRDRFSVTILAGHEGDLLDDAAQAGFDVVRLRHMGLQAPEIRRVHAVGWDHYLPRLAEIAEGRDPGVDPWTITRMMGEGS